MINMFALNFVYLSFAAEKYSFYSHIFLNLLFVVIFYFNKSHKKIDDDQGTQNILRKSKIRVYRNL